MKHEIWELQSMQAAPLSTKVALTKQRIREWVDEYGENGVYVSFSGGKDSTVLLHIAREIYPDIKAVFSDTGLEFPETREFVKQFDNVDWVKPKMSFVEVINKYGYPMISKEVSECVWGARKYLTQVIESESALNERTNERTNEVACPEISSVVRNRRVQTYFWEWTKLTGTGRFGKQYSKQAAPTLGGWRTLAFY